MRTPALLGLAATPLGLYLLQAGCSDLPPAVVSIRPIYAWEDGCAQVKVSGNGFGEDVQITIGGEPLQNLTQPDPEADPLDVGFVVYGVVPPGVPGQAEVLMTTGEYSDDIPSGFTYLACPGLAYVEAVDPVADIGAGSTINLQGCGLDASAVTVRVGPSTDVPLASVCGSASASFSAPDNEPGTWIVSFYDSQGNRLSPSEECDVTQPVVPDEDTGYYYDYYYDTAFQPDPCGGAPTLTYGGAR